MNSLHLKNLLAVTGLALSALSTMPTHPAAAEDIIVRTGPSHRERREIARERARDREIARDRERREAHREARERYDRHHHRDVLVVP